MTTEHKNYTVVKGNNITILVWKDNCYEKELSLAKEVCLRGIRMAQLPH